MTDRQREAIRAMYDAWAASDYPLSGSVNYQDAMDALMELGLYTEARQLLQFVQPKE